MNEFGDTPVMATGVNEFGDKAISSQAPAEDMNKLPWYMQTALKGFGGVAHDAVSDAATNAGNVASDVGQSLVNRTGEAAQSERDYQAGKISLPVELFQQAGKLVGGTAGDAIGSVIKNFTPAPVTNALQGGAQAVSNAIDTNAPAVGNVALSASNTLNQLAKDNPQTYKTLESAGDMMNIPPAMAALKAASPMVAGVGDALSRTGQAIGDASDLKSVTAQITPDMLKDATNAKYKEFRDNGAVLGQQGVDLVQNSIKDSIKQTGALDPVRHSDTASVLSQINDAAKTGAMDLEQLDGFRQQLGEVIKDNTKSKVDGGGLNSDGMKAQAAKNGLDDAVNQLNGSHLTAGTPDAVDALNNGRGLYAAKMKLDAVNRIVEDSNLTANPSTAMRTGFKNLYKSIRANGAGWTPDEVSAVKNAAQTSVVGGAVHLLGSRIISGVVGGVTGGAGGGILGSLAGTAAMEGLTFPLRKLSTAMQTGRANQVADLVTQRPVIADLAQSSLESRKLLPKFTALKALGVVLDKTGNLLRGGEPFGMREAMQLPPAQAVPALNEMKLLASPDKMTPLPMTDREIAIARKQMEQHPVTGADTSGNAIATAPTRYLPAPDAVSILPPEVPALTYTQANIARRQIQQPKLTGADISGAALRPPISQTLKIEGSANWIQSKQFGNMQQKLLGGEISQNQFVDTAQQAFGLNREQARSLAKEVKNYGTKQTP